MKGFIRLRVRWFDESLLELEVTASNGIYSGAADCYEALDSAASLATQLAGFPADPNDQRSVVLGTFDPGFAGGGARLGFAAQDRSGHSQIRVDLRANPQKDQEASASFSVAVEAASIDRFLTALRRMPLVVGAEAQLDGVG